jgi:hypothetical protein
MFPAPPSSEDDSIPEHRVTPPPSRTPLKYLPVGQDSDTDDEVEDDEPVETRRQDTQSDTAKKRKKLLQPNNEPVETRRQDTQSDKAKKRKKLLQPSPDQDTQSGMVKKRKKKAQRSPDVTNPKQKAGMADVPPLKLTCEIVLSPTVLAQIAEHIEALFLKKMMQKLND